MAKADRLERLDAQRVRLETEYEEALVAALHKCAAGSWGLFEHTQNRLFRENWKLIVAELCDLGQEIDQMRDTLGLGPFTLHQEFEASRGPVPSNAPGEPKQAKAWLERLGKGL